MCCTSCTQFEYKTLKKRKKKYFEQLNWYRSWTREKLNENAQSKIAAKLCKNAQSKRVKKYSVKHNIFDEVQLSRDRWTIKMTESIHNKRGFLGNWPKETERKLTFPYRFRPSIVNNSISWWNVTEVDKCFYELPIRKGVLS